MKRLFLISIILIGFCMAGCAGYERWGSRQLIGQDSSELLVALGGPTELITGVGGATWIYVVESSPESSRQYVFYIDEWGRIRSYEIRTVSRELPVQQPRATVEEGETEVVLSGPEAEAGTLTEKEAPPPPPPVAEKPKPPEMQEKKEAPPPPPPVAEEPKPSEAQVVEKIVYTPVPVTREVHANRYIFPTITFAEGSAELRPKANFDEKTGEFVSGGAQIEQAAELIKKAGSDKNFVEGNIDTAEKEKYPNLGRTRAEAVVKALADLGVDPKVLEIVDDGASKPLASSDTEAGRALNRRVAFTVIPSGQSLEPETLVQPPAPQVGPNVRIVEKVVEKEVATPKLVVTDYLIFPNILFEYDKANLTPEGLQNTKEAAEALKVIKGVKKVVVAGNCDSRGSDAYNDELSLRRADSVKNELVKDGLDASMLQAVGNGKRKPIASNDTPKGMAANRRVEFEVEH